MQTHVVPVDPLADIAAPHRKAGFARRDASFDPLLLATAAASAHVTKNHYNNNFFPPIIQAEPNSVVDAALSSQDEHKNFTYDSRVVEETQSLKKHRLPTSAPPTETHPVPVPSSSVMPLEPVQVKCMARTRIPTPHGSAFLHLYHNNRDQKEHLAIVIDPAQFSETPTAALVPPIRSRTLDAVWSENETEMDRITRGAYVGRLSPTSQHAYDPALAQNREFTANIPAPLIRVHSECFTGETVGSMRCDCGEQLDEAIRRISQPVTIPGKLPDDSPVTIPGRGAVVYLRQEGRGIGLLSKIRAYNLQDLGHDTVTANLMLGHRADERGYELAGAILRDLGLGGDADSEGVRVLTNNPDKVEALQKEGVKVVERVAMIPRSWQCRWKQQSPFASGLATPSESIPGATLIGGNAVHGDDLDKYLRTKVTKMGHMLPLWMDEDVAS